MDHHSQAVDLNDGLQGPQNSENSELLHVDEIARENDGDPSGRLGNVIYLYIYLVLPR